MSDLRVIILAAGKGTRMKSKLPKVLHRVCGKPIIQYVLDLARSLGSLKTYVVVGHQREAVQKSLSRDLRVVVQKKLLGTADAVRAAAPQFRSHTGDVLVLSGDTVLLKPQTVKNLIREHRKSKSSCSLLSALVDNPQGYGRIIRHESDAVITIQEDKDATPLQKQIREINVGVYCFRSVDLFDVIRAVQMNPKKGEFYLIDIVKLFQERGLKVSVFPIPDPTEGLGINSRQDLALAESILRKRILQEFMSQGVTIVAPEATFIAADTKVGRDTVIYPFTVIEENVRIGERCTLGPFCHLRPGTRIGHDVQVGNFTELSRSHLGDRSFMKHFSFLGDARVGASVNIGAGVVTANFDGRKKNVTRIQDGAFIGSDSILIAPVKIGAKAATGAGSVLTKNQTVPPGCVAVGVPARVVAKRKF